LNSTKIIHQPYHTLSPEQVERLIRLQDKVWPKEGNMAKAMEERVELYLHDHREDYQVFLIESNGVLVAHAEVFPRIILTAAGEIEIMALASVCSPADRRGEGWGKKVVELAFSLVDRGAFPVALFQTRVPGFYEKLGGREVQNVFVNSRAADGLDPDPWWNPHRMIYPGSYTDWPEGEIDLLGKAY
jgi:hypothetical protein